MSKLTKHCPKPHVRVTVGMHVDACEIRSFRQAVIVSPEVALRLLNGLLCPSIEGAGFCADQRHPEETWYV